MPMQVQGGCTFSNQHWEFMMSDSSDVGKFGKRD
jgi:hypothetical protein